MRKYLCILILFIMSMMFINIFARDITFRTLTINDGLPETTANVIFKDNLGFMWFGMHNGLCRFDGIKIKTHPDFISETIRTICQIDSTHLWVGTLSGLKVIDLVEGGVRTILSPNNKAFPEVYSLLHHNGQLYICTASGLYVYSQNGIKHIQVSQNTFSSENVIMNICFDRDENCWVMTLGGLFRYDISQNKFTRFSESIPASVPINYASMTSFGNKLYISIETIGLWVFNLYTKKMESPIPLKDRNIRSISCQDSILYVATGIGLKLISLQDYQVIKTIKPDEDRLNGLKSSAVYSFFLDEELLWLGTYAGGISYTYLKEPNFDIYSCSDVKFTTVNRNVRSSCVDKYGNRLIGTRDGLYYIQKNRGRLHYFTTQNTKKLLSNTILFLYLLNNDILIGTSAGLYLFNPDNLSFSFFKEDSIFKNEAFYVVDHDKSNNLWFGISGGVICYNQETQKLKRYTSENSNVFNSDIHTIKCDSKNRVWAAGINGICLINQSNGKVIDQILPLEFDSKLQSVRCVFEDSHGRIWICTSKDGLLRLNESLINIDYFTDHDLLPSNVLYNILEDKEGYLWIATLKGILMYNNETGEKRIFDSSDGLPDYTFNLYNHIDNNGIIWWGSENGLIYCNPSKVRSSHKDDPNIVITSIVIAGKEVLLIEDDNIKRKVTPEYVNSIHLSSFENNITFYLSQLSFSTSKGSYEYKLDTYDKSWHKIIDNNEISYRDLPSGTYSLIIRKLGGKSEKIIKIVVRRSISPIVYGGISILLMAIIIFIIGKYLDSRKYKNKSDRSNFDLNEEQRKKYSSSKIQQTQLAQIREQLLVYMNEEKPYLNSQLKLSDIAAAISCSPTYLSQCLNQELNTNFTDFTNSYRIELFKQKLKQEKVSQYTLFALAQSCGFSSRTSFFRLFKKQTGFSPLEYIKTKEGLSLSEDDIE